MSDIKNIRTIKEELKAAQIEMLPFFITQYQDDSRKGVASLVKKAKEQMDGLKREEERVERLCAFEKEYSQYDFICGIDEVGRGPLAGPVVAGAVILPKHCRILHINDSKKLSEKRREELCEVIKEKAISYATGVISPKRIDEINILQATYEAMQLAVKKLEVMPDILLNDAVTIPNLNFKQVPIVKGDEKSISIAAASILAKVTRDHMMVQYSEMMPEYDFASHKGYGTKVHIEAIKTYGLSPIHRRSFISFLS